MMIGYDIYDCFTMEHFRLRQRMTLTTKIYCSRLYMYYIATTTNWFLFILCTSHIHCATDKNFKLNGVLTFHLLFHFPYS
jgi:hypothetical protein